LSGGGFFNLPLVVMTCVFTFEEPHRSDALQECKHTFNFY
jgi:hypothetical protein